MGKRRMEMDVRQPLPPLTRTCDFCVDFHGAELLHLFARDDDGVFRWKKVCVERVC